MPCIDLCRPYQIVCLRESAHQPRRAIFAPLEDFLGETGAPVVGEFDDAIYAIVQPPDPTFGDQLAAVAGQPRWRNSAAGSSRHKATPGALATAMRETSVSAVSGSGPRQGTDQLLATRAVQLAAGMPIRLARQRRTPPPTTSQ